MALPPCLVIAFRRGQHGQEGQRPDPLGPGKRHEQHQTDPAQPARLGKMRLAGAGGIAIDAFGRDLGPAPPLQRFIHPDHHGSARHKCANEQPQQDVADGQTGPHGAVQDAMIGAERGEMAEPQHAQHHTHHALARRQDGADHEQLGMPPHARRKQRGERGQACHNLSRQGDHRQPLFAGVVAPIILLSSPYTNGQSLA